MSSQQKRRIVVTGFGMFSPIGIGRAEFQASLNSGSSGIRRTEYYRNSVTPGGVGGEVPGFSEESAKKQYLKSQRKSLKVMCREIQLGTAAALQAIEDAGLDLDSLDHSRFGIEYGANLMFFSPETMADACRAACNSAGDFVFDQWGGPGIASMEPLWMLKFLPNMPACHIAIFTDSRGPNNSVTLDEASPGVALTEALNIMERGAADVMLVGGTGTRLHPVRAVHARLFDQLGYEESNPAASCKPFDERRNGQVVAEGSACLVLEEESHAKARGAKILGTLLSGASSCVNNVRTGADIAQAVANASRAALRRAGMSPQDLGHINAHGLGGVDEDRAEAAGLRQLLGESTQVPVTGLKGFFGNAGAATGFFEAVASLLAVGQGRIPQTLNCGNPDPSLGLDIVRGDARPTANKRFLNVNFTRIGQASATVFEGV